MTKLLDRRWSQAAPPPPAAQKIIARVVIRCWLALTREAPWRWLTPEEAAAIAASKAAAARGEFATDEEVRAVWAKHGL